MYNAFLHAHSGFRWIVLILLIWTVVQAFLGWTGKKEYGTNNQRSALFTNIFVDIQFLLGLVLYFISPKVAFVDGVMGDSVMRFFTVEHILMMIIAIALLKIGSKAAKKTTEAVERHKKIAIYYGIALLIILAAIPWPFRELGAGWI